MSVVNVQNRVASAQGLLPAEVTKSGITISAVPGGGGRRLVQAQRHIAHHHSQHAGGIRGRQLLQQPEPVHQTLPRHGAGSPRIQARHGSAEQHLRAQRQRGDVAHLPISHAHPCVWFGEPVTLQPLLRHQRFRRSCRRLQFRAGIESD